MDIKLRQVLNESWDKLSSIGHESAFKNITVSNYAAYYINAYTVVLREVSGEDNTLIFYTDVRSKKVNEIKQNNKLTITAYSHDERLQLILKGEAVIHYQDDTAKQYWNKDGFKGRRSYLAQPAPSTQIDEPADGLAYLSTEKFEDADSTGYENFAVVKVNISYLEYVKLNREGNRRANFVLDAINNSWHGRWLIP